MERGKTCARQSTLLPHGHAITGALNVLKIDFVRKAQERTPRRGFPVMRPAFVAGQLPT